VTTPSPGPLRPTCPPLGAHMSIAGGHHHAIEAAVAAGCDCLQLFVKNQRQWKAAPIPAVAADEFRQAFVRSGLVASIAHASYLLNLAAIDREQRDRSVEALIDELERCEMLGIGALVLHPGAAMGDPPSRGIRRIAGALNRVLRATDGCPTRLLLENVAGQGTTIGATFEQLARIRDGVKAWHRMGVCLDTCHLFAAGYDFRTPDGYAAVMGALDATLGAEHVHCIHTNDSKGPLGGRLDRHEHIGEGQIGRSGFANFLNDPRWREVPFILETPKGTDERQRDFDRLNLQRLRRLVRKRPSARSAGAS
jgi:deoxyribonuclease-4